MNFIQVSVGNHELDHTKGNDPTGEDVFNPSWWHGGDSNGECGVPTFVRWGSAIPEGLQPFFCVLATFYIKKAKIFQNILQNQP